MRVTKELSASLDYFRLMFVFLRAIPPGWSSEPVPFRTFVCYLLAVLMTVDLNRIKEPSPWNGSPRNTKRST
jgi:hypothetical protein